MPQKKLTKALMTEILRQTLDNDEIKLWPDDNRRLPAAIYLSIEFNGRRYIVATEKEIADKLKVTQEIAGCVLCKYVRERAQDAGTLRMCAKGLDTHLGATCKEWKYVRVR